MTAPIMIAAVSKESNRRFWPRRITIRPLSATTIPIKATLKENRRRSIACTPLICVRGANPDAEHTWVKNESSTVLYVRPFSLKLKFKLPIEILRLSNTKQIIRYIEKWLHNVKNCQRSDIIGGNSNICWLCQDWPSLPHGVRKRRTRSRMSSSPMPTSGPMNDVSISERAVNSATSSRSKACMIDLPVVSTQSFCSSSTG